MQQAQRLKSVRYDIRGPVLEEAKRLEDEGAGGYAFDDRRNAYGVYGITGNQGYHGPEKEGFYFLVSGGGGRIHTEPAAGWTHRNARDEWAG